MLVAHAATGCTATRYDRYCETRENVSGSNRYSISGNKTADRIGGVAATVTGENLSVYTCVCARICSARLAEKRARISIA